MVANNMKKTNKNMILGIGLGMCLGIALGSSVGETLFNGNIAGGMSIGISFGLIIGAIIGLAKDKEINKQILEKGYTIKKIEENKDMKEYKITIVSNSKEEVIIDVSKGIMEIEQFSIGDIVFLDEDGQIEQAFDKEDD